jgi:small subunit ribosomal protein S1
VFETVFTVDSVHKGTLTAIVDKGGIVTLPYGVEGFVPSRHLTKEDGSKVAVEESLDFKVLEFSKDGKRILLSHLDTYFGSQSSDRQDRKPDKRSKGKSIRKAVKEVRDNLEKTTLGDLDAFSSLKSEMENASKASAKEDVVEEAPAKEKVKEEPVDEVPAVEEEVLEEPAAAAEEAQAADEVLKEEQSVEEEPVAEETTEEPAKQEAEASSADEAEEVVKEEEKDGDSIENESNDTDADKEEK